MATSIALFLASLTDPQLIEMKLRPRFKFMVFLSGSTISLKSRTSGIVSKDDLWMIPKKLLKKRDI